MSKTPIYDFVKEYAKGDNSRFHMPGHKGKAVLGCEDCDLTEIDGADSLFEADGIIAQSEKTLSEIFGTRASFYSTEGSSLCIRTMLFLATCKNSVSGKRKKVLAARNVHKSFLSAAALCDFDVEWLSCEGDNLYSCTVNEKKLEEKLLSGEEYCALYVTSPDYLGNMLDIASLSRVCRKHSLPLVVDNAHGAYLAFFGLHPMQLGADMCCDSAHKTLPVLTGGAYLHVSKECIYNYEADVKCAMSLFASTSPSYLVLASMDKANEMMLSDDINRYQWAKTRADRIRNVLLRRNIAMTGTEPLKITVCAKSAGYTGTELAEMMKDSKIYAEFCDEDFAVLMLSPQNSDGDFERLESFFNNLCLKTPVASCVPEIPVCRSVMTQRQASFAKKILVNAKDAKGRVLAAPSVSCPPAIPVAVCGDELCDDALKCFEYYGIHRVLVVEE